jgi:histidinol dehydrogenase
MASPRGVAAVERLLRRGERVLDRRTLRGAERIVNAVRRRGDAALLDFARRLDGAEAERIEALRLTPSLGDARGAELTVELRVALEIAIGAVERYHRRQAYDPQAAIGPRHQEFRWWALDRLPAADLPEPLGFRAQDPEAGGVEWEERVTPLRRVGIYVPGGRASYPSTAVMTVVPARIAGVREIVVVTPLAAYRGSAALRYTLARLGVEEVWGIGGAHAVAALAYGTASIARVDKIVGPGNAWVTAAKKLVAGDVGIDGIAGPSEVVIVADGTADASDLAADLLAQAEHDPLAAAVLLTPDRALARRVAAAVEEQLASLATAATARDSLARFGAALVVPNLEAALDLVERIAPEHLQLVGPGAEALAGRVVNAGAIFAGGSTPEVFGDYIGGPSHVLPTCGSARFASPLGVDDFRRRSHVLRFTPEAARLRAQYAVTLAEAEGLPAHAAAARRRMG